MTRDCPECGSSDTHIVDTRSIREAVRRRRQCRDCRQRWTTYEITAEVFERLSRRAQAYQRLCKAIAKGTPDAEES